jgi:hypothetical protein
MMTAQVHLEILLQTGEVMMTETVDILRAVVARGTLILRHMIEEMTGVYWLR